MYHSAFSTVHAVVALTTGLLLLSWAVAPSEGIAEQEVGLGIDGLRCDSCGTDCSTYCGSRAFRTCCFNYIKKRSSPLSPSLLSPSSRAQQQQHSSRMRANNNNDYLQRKFVWSLREDPSTLPIFGGEEEGVVPPNNPSPFSGGSSSSH